jgi:nucleoside-diphosphate-sugar epimerase
MRILIAGGAGYVGSALVPRLAERGYDVTVVDLLWFGNHLPPGTRVVRKDVLGLSAEELEGFDQVIFMAGLSNDPMAEYSPSANFVANAACPAYLAYIAKQAGVRRFIYGSSCSVYGCSADELLDEASPAASAFPYGIAKLQGEFAARQLADDRFSVITLRKGTVCGYSPRMRLDLVVNTMFMTAVTECVVRVDNPSVWRPILAVQDAATAYVRAVECHPGISGTFNVASGNFTLGELADCVHDGVREALGITPRVEIGRRADLRDYRVSIERARDVLSFRPRASIPDVVRDLVEHREAFSDFRSDRYYNIAMFRKLDLRPALG